ncbi:MAG: hypothetical protein BA874_02640 [Desulfuromonadales bacterium C00003068]|jgi:putative N6-adenine-specific DNA methylase|nr:MAG: hypothetical protein BA874_02640 [Desulfuromonadales bacterium C00003068]
MKNTTEQFFVIVPPGFESTCAKELAQWVDAPLTLCHGGITFAGKLRDLYLANLWLRCASRILVRLDSFSCRDFPTLHRKSLRLPWGRFIQPGRPLTLRVTCRGSRLIHSDRVAETIEKAIHKALGTTAADSNVGQESQTIFVRLDDDACTISIDSSGDLLHKRGYRVKSTTAPLRETLAAGCLLHCNWHGETPLWDPFCGSGTFPIEAAMIAANIPPGNQRTFSFMNWPGFRQGLWNALISEANKLKRDTIVTINGSDLNEDALSAAQQNAKQAGVNTMIQFHQHDAFSPYDAFDEGLLICNPPYGERLASAFSPAKLLKKLAQQLKDSPKISTAIVLPHDKQMPQNTQLNFSNGGLDVALYSTKKSRTR